MDNSRPAAGDGGVGLLPGSASSATETPRAPDAIYGDWHEDIRASTDERQVFVPRSVALGPAWFRRTLHFGRDGSFSTLRLDPADAHYECAGTFSVVAKNELSARCKDPKTSQDIEFTIRILEARDDRLVVQMTP
jgi:hypothetical protein